MAAVDSSDGLQPPARWFALATLAVGVTMAVLDGAIANIALPTIAKDLATTPAASIWVVNAYQLVVTVALLPLSSLGDIYGYKRVYIAGLAMFTLASLGCALSHTLPMLVTMRTLQGLGGAGIMSVNTALIRFVFPRAMLGRGVGLNALMVAVSSATGPSIAAGILAVADWPWLFAINVPLGALALSVSPRTLPGNPLSGHRFDLSSAVLNALTLGPLIVAVDGLGRGGAMPWLLGAVAVSAVAGVVFVQRQRTLAAPMLPVDLFRRPVFALSVATSVCCYTAQSLAFVSLPFYFEDVGRHGQIATGLLITPWPLVVVFVAPLAGRLSDRYPPGLLGALGLVAMTAGFLLLLFMSPYAAWPDVAWRMAICGLGFGFFQSPNNRLMLASAPRERSGAGSGMLSTARLLGQTTGSALVALAFGLGGVGAAGIARGTTIAIGMGAAFAAAATVVSAVRLRQA